MEATRKDAALSEIEAILKDQALKYLTEEELSVIIFEEVLEKIVEAEKNDWVFLMYSHGDLQH